MNAKVNDNDDSNNSNNNLKHMFRYSDVWTAPSYWGQGIKWYGFLWYLIKVFIEYAGQFLHSLQLQLQEAFIK
jgi:hypothetical protein